MTPILRRILALLIASATVLAACGGDGGDEGGGGGGGDGEEAAELPECPVGAHEEAGGPVEVTLWHTFVARPAEVLDELVAQYNASQDVVEVKAENQGQSYDELLNKYNQAIPNDQLPDLAVFDDTLVQYMADSGTIMPAQSCFDAAGESVDDFVPIARDYYSIDGALQPASFNLASALIYFNVDHFEDAGLDPANPPATLDDVRAAAQAIKDAGISDAPLAFNMQPWLVEFWLTGVGEPVVNNENGREGAADAAAFDNEAAVELFTWMDEMIQDGLMKPFSNTPGQIDDLLAIGLGNSSMAIGSDSVATSIEAFLEGSLDPSTVPGGEDVDAPDADGLRIGAGPLPGLEAPGRGQVGGATWWLVDGPPEELAGAWDFIQFLNQPENQARWVTEAGYHPTTETVAADPSVEAFWAERLSGQWLKLSYDALAELDSDFPGPLIGPYSQVRDVVRQALDSMAFEEVPPEEAVAQADERITEAIATYNEENF